MKPFYVYMLRCADGSYYVGHTDDIDRRYAEHRSGGIDGYTAQRLPVALVFLNEFPSREDAKERERQIKGWSRKKKEALIADDWNAIHRYAQRMTKFEKEDRDSATASLDKGAESTKS